MGPVSGGWDCGLAGGLRIHYAVNDSAGKLNDHIGQIQITLATSEFSSCTSFDQYEESATSEASPMQTAGAVTAIRQRLIAKIFLIIALPHGF